MIFIDRYHLLLIIDINFYNKINICRFIKVNPFGIIDGFSVDKFTYNQFTDKFYFCRKSIDKYNGFWVFSMDLTC